MKKLSVRGFAIISEMGRSASVLITCYVNGETEPRPVRWQRWFENVGDAPYIGEKIEVEEMNGRYWWDGIEEN